MAECRYRLAWTSCRSEAAEGSPYCVNHTDIPCGVCGSPSTHECSYTGQFVCGKPLCDNCEGYQTEENGFGEASDGAWGFLRHCHRQKELNNETN